VFALLCARRASGALRALLIFTAVAFAGVGFPLTVHSAGQPLLAVLSMLSPPAVLAGEGAEWLLDAPPLDGAEIACTVYLAALAVLFLSASYLKIEALLDRRPFHEV
jgi:hypothetical protein